MRYRWDNRKYIIFGFDEQYPLGGLRDIKGSNDNLEGAIVSAKKGVCADCVYIVDRDTWETVWEKHRRE